MLACAMQHETRRVRRRAPARSSCRPSTRRSASAPASAAPTPSEPTRPLPIISAGKRPMSDIKNVMSMIKEHDVKYVDFRFTDPRGKWQHLAHHVKTINEHFLAEGVMFDGSSIAGWKAINESDMVLMPDCATAVLDPF